MDEPSHTFSEDPQLRKGNDATEAAHVADWNQPGGGGAYAWVPFGI